MALVELTWVKVVLCLLLAGVGQVEEWEEGLWEELCTDIELVSPSVFNFLKAPSRGQFSIMLSVQLHITYTIL